MYSHQTSLHTDAPTPPLLGLVLTGGPSHGMEADKALLSYRPNVPHLYTCHDLLSRVCEGTWISSRPDQAEGPERSGLAQIVDRYIGLGPLTGILSAFAARPDAAWLVIGCDMPFLDERALGNLVRARDPRAYATTFLRFEDSRPEPVCTIYEPRCYQDLVSIGEREDASLSDFLQAHTIQGVLPLHRRTLRHVETPKDYQDAVDRITRLSRYAS